MVEDCKHFSVFFFTHAMILYHGLHKNEIFKPGYLKV